MQYAIVEKSNPLAVHGICESLSSAEWFLANRVPEYVRLRYYTDKTLTAASFMIVPWPRKAAAIRAE